MRTSLLYIRPTLIIFYFVVALFGRSERALFLTAIIYYGENESTLY